LQCGFSGGVHFAIRLTIFGNLPLQDILYMSQTSFAMQFQWWYPFCHQTNHIWQFAITRHIICSGPVLQCHFNGGVHFAIRLTIFGNLPLWDILYMSWTSFAVRIQWWCPFCYHTNHIWQFAIPGHIIYVLDRFCSVGSVVVSILLSD